MTCVTHPDLEVLPARAGAVVVLLRGEHDLSTKGRLHKTFSSLLERHQLVVADLSEVLFIDSSTLGVLVLTDRAAKASGKTFRLQLGTEPIVKRVLEISGLMKVLDCYPTRNEAIDPQSKPPGRLL
jgi:anti-anti-sigma factor